MIIESKYLIQRTILICTACVLGLTGCGGGEDDSSSAANSTGGSSLGGGLLCLAVVLTSGDDSCVSAIVSGSSSSSSSSDSSSSSGSGGGSGGPAQSAENNSIYLADNNEMEPNNDLMNANVPQYAIRPDPNDQTGWMVNGSANDANDTRDAFALTPHRPNSYWIALCPPGGVIACSGPVGMDPLTLFWRLLDQDGNEITSSQGAYSNKTRVALNAGVMYYVVVDAGDTMGVSVAYKLKVFELP